MMTSTLLMSCIGYGWVPVADPGHTKEGANTLGGAIVLFDQFSRKLHENEDFLARKVGGGVSLDPPLDLAQGLEPTDVTHKPLTLA